MNNRIEEPEFVKPPRTTKAEKRWTLLFIGDRGKTITFHRFKSLVMLALLILLASAAVSGWFWYLYDNARIESRILNEKMENLEQALASARNEKDILTARLVVAESKAEQTIAKVIAEKPVKPPVKRTPKPSQPVEKPAADKLEPVMSVVAENFLVFYEPDVNTLSVQYKIRNTGSKEQPVSGRSVVILKDGEENPKKWLVLPWVPLESGKPEGDKGRSFSIYNFRTMRFKANDQIGPDQYKKAWVYVFLMDGTLLLEKEFPVGIKSVTVSAVGEPAPQEPAVKKPTPAKPQQQVKPQPVSTPAETPAPATEPSVKPDIAATPAEPAPQKPADQSESGGTQVNMP
jgi:outer membrane biosynthesis protein TonB